MEGRQCPPKDGRMHAVPLRTMGFDIGYANLGLAVLDVTLVVAWDDGGVDTLTRIVSAADDAEEKGVIAFGYDWRRPALAADAAKRRGRCRGAWRPIGFSALHKVHALCAIKIPTDAVGTNAPVSDAKLKYLRLGVMASSFVHRYMRPLFMNVHMLPHVVAIEQQIKMDQVAVKMALFGALFESAASATATSTATTYEDFDRLADTVFLVPHAGQKSDSLKPLPEYAASTELVRTRTEASEARKKARDALKKEKEKDVEDEEVAVVKKKAFFASSRSHGGPSSKSSKSYGTEESKQEVLKETAVLVVKNSLSKSGHDEMRSALDAMPKTHGVRDACDAFMHALQALLWSPSLDLEAMFDAAARRNLASMPSFSPDATPELRAWSDTALRPSRPKRAKRARPL